MESAKCYTTEVPYVIGVWGLVGINASRALSRRNPVATLIVIVDRKERILAPYRILDVGALVPFD